MDPTTRRWWLLLDQLPDKLGPVSVWRDSSAMPGGDGHMHANPTAVVCLTGVVRISRPGRKADLKPGEALLLAPGIWHRHESLRPGSVWFGLGYLSAWSDVLLGDDQREWHGKLPAEPGRRLMDEALAATDENERTEILKRCVRQVLDESVSELAWEHPAMGRMVDALWQRLHLGVSVDDLVRVSGLRRTRAYALFTRGYGVPPKQAIAQSRLWLAKGLLEADLPVAEVARRCGYPSADTFRRCWRRAYGAPPREARRH
ncbi:MAG TPA: AraC family transcriptional regulator [Planctomycetota bacterium]|nr:AraC family transcriptional regulator [Planctomycetota bacterium]